MTNHNSKQRVRLKKPSLLVLVFCWLLPSLLYAENAFNDPLYTPSSIQLNPEKKPIMDISLSGNRFVASGMRGLIIISDDQGESWQQTPSPVQTDLLSSHFSSDKEGWIVGHNGVILYSQDGAKTWVKQLDGLKAAESLATFYSERIQSGEEDFNVFLQQTNMNFRADASLPLLDIWMDDNGQGYAVGAFGTLLYTANAGDTWQPAFHKIDNPEMLHLNAIAKIKDNIFIAAERGHVFRYEESTDRFVPQETGYAGGLFGIDGNDSYIIAYGLGGKAFISNTDGVEWRAVANDSTASLTASTYHPEKNLLILANSEGGLLSLDNGQYRLRTIKSTSALITDVITTPKGKLITAGLAGVNLTP